MYEIGNTIPQIIWNNMAKAPDTGVPIFFSKIDLKDDYWGMVVNESDTWKFSYVLIPLNPGDDIKLIISDALQIAKTAYAFAESNFFLSAQQANRRKILPLISIGQTYQRQRETQMKPSFAY